MKYKCQFPNQHQKLYHILKAQPNTFSYSHPKLGLLCFINQSSNAQIALVFLSKIGKRIPDQVNIEPIFLT